MSHTESRALHVGHGLVHQAPSAPPAASGAGLETRRRRRWSHRQRGHRCRSGAVHVDVAPLPGARQHQAVAASLDRHEQSRAPDSGRHLLGRASTFLAAARAPAPHPTPQLLNLRWPSRGVRNPRAEFKANRPDASRRTGLRGHGATSVLYLGEASAQRVGAGYLNRTVSTLTEPDGHSYMVSMLGRDAGDRRMGLGRATGAGDILSEPLGPGLHRPGG
jgi:hypothetical protein